MNKMGKSCFERTGYTKKELKETENKNRHISDSTMRRVKSVKKCFHCKKPFKGYWEKEAHHLKPVICGGKSTITNLVCVHKGKCHKEMDKRAFKKYGDKKNE